MTQKHKTISEKIAEATTMTVKVEFEMMADTTPEYDDGGFEIASNLQWIAKELAEWFENNTPRDHVIHDINGNTVGHVTVVYD